MSDTVKRFLWVSAYAIAMAFLEAVVVVYIRALLHLSDLRTDLGPYAIIETWREAATLVMLVTVGWLAGREKIDRLAYGLFAFGLWDIWYYIWLKVLINWPKTLLDWDILFLIPFPWRGPVLCPVLIACLVCFIATLIVYRVDKREMPRITLVQSGSIVCGVLLALYVFMAGAIHTLIRGGADWRSAQPDAFNWPLFFIALMLMAVPSLKAFWPWKRKTSAYHKP